MAIGTQYTWKNEMFKAEMIKE